MYQSKMWISSSLSYLVSMILWIYFLVKIYPDISWFIYCTLVSKRKERSITWGSTCERNFDYGLIEKTRGYARSWKVFIQFFKKISLQKNSHIITSTCILFSFCLFKPMLSNIPSLRVRPLVSLQWHSPRWHSEEYSLRNRTNRFINVEKYEHNKGKTR